jgi:hypothetical protein
LLKPAVFHSVLPWVGYMKFMASLMVLANSVQPYFIDHLVTICLAIPFLGQLAHIQLPFFVSDDG